MKTFRSVACVVIFLISFIAVAASVYFMIFDRWFVVRLLTFMFFGAIMLVTGKLLPKSARRIAKPVLQIMMIVGAGMCVYGVVLIVQFIRNMDLDFFRLIKGGMMIAYGVVTFILAGSAQNFD